MEKENQIVKKVFAAKENENAANEFIKEYIPFVKATASKVIKRICTENDDEFSIALMAFHEAILNYNYSRGSFLGFAALSIRSRIVDYLRRESKHRALVSLDEKDEEDRTLGETIGVEDEHIENAHSLEAAKEEIAELQEQLLSFDITFSDIAENCPKQERTLEICKEAVNYACKERWLLDEVLKTKKLPISALCQGTGIPRKTLERHRKYLLAMLIIQTNGYEIIRGHLRSTKKGGGFI